MISNLIKWKSKIDYSQDSIWDHFGCEPAVITTTLCSTATGESLKVLYTHPYSLGGIILEKFKFPETVQLFLNPTPITHSSINPNRTKTNHHWPNNLHTHTHTRARAHTHTRTLNYATSLAVGLRGSSQTPGVAK